MGQPYRTLDEFFAQHGLTVSPEQRDAWDQLLQQKCDQEGWHYLRIDPACLSLFHAINALPGLQVLAAESGQGRATVRIRFQAEVLASLQVALYYAGTWGWWCTACVEDLTQPLCVALESAGVGQRAYTQADAIAAAIMADVERHSGQSQACKGTRDA
jgi:hypothetical protein